MHPDVSDWLSQGKFFQYNGRQVFYLQQGSGEDLLILHGYPYNTFEWKSIIAVLAGSYRVTAFDLPGMGFSDKPQDHRYSYEEYCEIANALLHSLGIERTHILSHDLGASVAQELLARDAEGRNGFAILSSAFSNGSIFIDVYKPRLIQRLLSQTPAFVGKFLSRKISKASVNKSVRSVFGKNTQPSDAFLDQQWDILNHNDGKAVSYLIGRLIFEKKRYLRRWVNVMQQTTVPLCYICGPADPNSGRHMADRYRELIPDPRIYFLSEGIGHWPFLEDEEGFLQIYQAFRGEIG